MAAYVLPTLGELTIAEVRRKHVSNLLWPTWREKHKTAHRVQGRLREVFELAVAEELREDNPAAFDPKVALGRVRKSTKHHGSLPPAEVQEFWDWLLTTPCTERTRGFVQLILLAARRTGEGRLAVWSDFDLGGLSWDEVAQAMGNLRPGEPGPLVIWDTPKARMRMDRGYRTPLSRQAVQVLLNLRRLAPTGVSGKAYVFASKTRATVMMNRGRASWLRSWAAQVAERRGRKRGMVALARCIGSVLHRMWRDNKVFQLDAPVGSIDTRGGSTANQATGDAAKPAR